MARVIILSFRDNEAAEALIEKLDDLQGYAFDPDAEHPSLHVHQDNLMELGATLAAHAKPEALLARPTAGCHCRRKGRVQGWTRTKRFGWFVCPECNRPSTLVVKKWMSNLTGTVGGNNQLQELRRKIHPDDPNESPPAEFDKEVVYIGHGESITILHPQGLIEGSGVQGESKELGSTLGSTEQGDVTIPLP